MLKRVKALGASALRFARGKHRFPSDFEREEIALIREVQPFTKTSRERLQALIRAVGYLVKNDIEGALAECGVWKGGSMMAAALALEKSGDLQRELFLYDTYEGMGEPHEKDVDCKGRSALEMRKERKEWSRCSLEEVRGNLSRLSYPASRIHLVKGPVEETLPLRAPERLALLRLDTDWYESTRHELIHLYPRLVSGGVLIVDDYGHWKGAKAAVDEYFEKMPFKPFFHRIDYTGRLILKP